ncbi:unnamed protein product [Leuciscus chuanchicus]
MHHTGDDAQTASRSDSQKSEPASGTAHSRELWIRSAWEKIHGIATFSSRLEPQPSIPTSFSCRGAGREPMDYSPAFNIITHNDVTGLVN